MNEKRAKQILNKTRLDYNRIADKFSSTRLRLSQDILDLAKLADARDRILDLGCGNGRLIQVFGKEINYIGADVSEKLLEIAKKLHPKNNFVLIKNPLILPFPDESFDKVFCLSVLHHIPTEKYQLQYLNEIKRILIPGGKLILTVWNMPEKTKDIFYPFTDPEKNIKIERYLHCFSIKELSHLIEKSGFKIEKSTLTKRGKIKEFSNILIIAQKESKI